jgi:hypothetical protein
VYDPRPLWSGENQRPTCIVDIQLMTRQDQHQPWWERPARALGEPEYVREREQFRAELARARRADPNTRGLRTEPPWGGPAAPQAAA